MNSLKTPLSPSKRHRCNSCGTASQVKRKRVDPVAQRVDMLIKSLLLSLQPHGAQPGHVPTAPPQSPPEVRPPVLAPGL